MFVLIIRDWVVRKNLPYLSSFLRFDRKCSELGPPLITKAGSAPGNLSKEAGPFIYIKCKYKYEYERLFI